MLPQPGAESSARIATWLVEIRPKSVGKSLAQLMRRNPALTRVVAGIADAAPYLWAAIAAKPSRLLRLLGADPAKFGFVAGGNMTGLSAVSSELMGKRLDLLREMNPLATTVA